MSTPWLPPHCAWLPWKSYRFLQLAGLVNCFVWSYLLHRKKRLTRMALWLPSSCCARNTTLSFGFAKTFLCHSFSDIAWSFVESYVCVYKQCHMGTLLVEVLTLFVTLYICSNIDLLKFLSFSRLATFVNFAIDNKPWQIMIFEQWTSLDIVNFLQMTRLVNL